MYLKTLVDLWNILSNYAHYIPIDSIDETISIKIYGDKIREADVQRINTLGFDVESSYNKPERRHETVITPGE